MQGSTRKTQVIRSLPLLRPPCPPPAAPCCLLAQTPDDGAIKWWIGNAAEDGRAATVFARLKASGGGAAQGGGGGRCDMAALVLEGHRDYTPPLAFRGKGHRCLGSAACGPV